MRKRQNGECNVRNFRRFSLRNEFWCTGIESPRFCKWLWILNCSKWMLVVGIPTKILLTKLLSIDHSSGCKLKVCETIYDKLIYFAKLVRRWKSREWAQFELQCLLLFIYANSKFKITCINKAFECRYIRTHTKEKLSKISPFCLFIS